MSRYWVSYEVPEEYMPQFEGHFPWWISGESDETLSVCYAIVAETEDEAKGVFLKSFDTEEAENSAELRFCDRVFDDFSPFTPRFPKASWMIWPVTAKEALEKREANQ